MRKRILIPILFVTILGVLVTGYWYFVLRGHVSTDDAFIDGDPLTLSAKITGRVTVLAADEGDTVRAGDTLVVLDDAGLRAEETEDVAGVELARQSAALADVSVMKAQEDFDRAASQFRSAVIPKEQYDHARQALAMAKAQERVAQAAITSAEAKLSVVRSKLENTRVVAPMNGVAARRWVLPGDVVQPGQAILTIYDPHDIWVTANFEETKLSSLSLDDHVSIHVDAYPDLGLHGRVSLISVAAASEFSLIPPNNASGNFTKVTQRVPIRIEFDTKELAEAFTHAHLLPGMSVEVEVDTPGR